MPRFIRAIALGVGWVIRSGKNPESVGTVVATGVELTVVEKVEVTLTTSVNVVAEGVRVIVS